MRPSDVNQSDGYNELHLAGDSSAFDVIGEVGDDDDPNIRLYHLKWREDCGNEYAGSEATCVAGRSSWWYIMYQYQPRVAVTAYTWTKTEDWTTVKDDLW